MPGIVHSMTGYGLGSSESDLIHLSVEIKGVNARFLEISFRGTPLRFDVEQELRAHLRKYVLRGKVEVVVTMKNIEKKMNTSLDSFSDESSLKHIETVLYTYKDLLLHYGVSPGSEEGDLVKRLLVKSFAGLNSEFDQKPIAFDDEIKDAFRAAVTRFVESRITEGQKLEVDLLSLLERLRVIVVELSTQSQMVHAARVELLIEKMRRLLEEAGDESRIHQEAAILAEKLDCREELVRLQTHLDEVLHTLNPIDKKSDEINNKKAEEAKAASSMGKKVDFLMQESLRELSTFAAKCQDATLQRRMVDAKLIVEQMREQIQNVQ